MSTYEDYPTLRTAFGGEQISGAEEIFIRDYF